MRSNLQNNYKLAYQGFKENFIRYSAASNPSVNSHQLRFQRISSIGRFNNAQFLTRISSQCKMIGLWYPTHQPFGAVSGLLSLEVAYRDNIEEQSVKIAGYFLGGFCKVSATLGLWCQPRLSQTVKQHLHGFFGEDKRLHHFRVFVVQPGWTKLTE